jgi:hypothetical protein
MQFDLWGSIGYGQNLEPQDVSSLFRRLIARRRFPFRLGMVNSLEQLRKVRRHTVAVEIFDDAKPAAGRFEPPCLG